LNSEIQGLGLSEFQSEARQILSEKLAELRRTSYADWQRVIGTKHSRTEQVLAPSGTKYQIQVQAFWDDQPEKNIRVMAAMDDGSLLLAMKPLCEDFIITPDGSFVGETSDD